MHVNFVYLFIILVNAINVNQQTDKVNESVVNENDRYLKNISNSHWLNRKTRREIKWENMRRIVGGEETNVLYYPYIVSELLVILFTEKIIFTELFTF